MRKPGRGPERVLTDRHRYKITMDVILEFLHQLPDDEFKEIEANDISSSESVSEEIESVGVTKESILQVQIKTKESIVVENTEKSIFNFDCVGLRGAGFPVLDHFVLSLLIRRESVGSFL